MVENWNKYKTDQNKECNVDSVDIEGGSLRTEPTCGLQPVRSPPMSPASWCA